MIRPSSFTKEEEIQEKLARAQELKRRGRISLV
jgi:hypothetical protein